MFKLSTDVAFEDEIIVEIYDPASGEPVTMGEDSDIKLTFTVSGPYSKAKLDADRKANVKVINSKKKKYSVDDYQELHTDNLYSRILKWSVISSEGIPVECSTDNLTAFFKEYPWVRTQIEEYINDNANFIKK